MVRAVLAEISGALQRLAAGGAGHTIFINKMGLSPAEREAVHEHLGEGSVRIRLENTDEPAEWLESGLSGVWFGVYYDHAERPVLETVEIAHFPAVAAAQTEDVLAGADRLTELLATME